MKKTNYIDFDIKGLPPLKRKGHNTRRGKPRNHIYKVHINDYAYYVVNLHRSDKHLTKYFKKKKEAKEWLDLLRVNRVWS